MLFCKRLNPDFNEEKTHSKQNICIYGVNKWNYCKCVIHHSPIIEDVNYSVYGLKQVQMTQMSS